MIIMGKFVEEKITPWKNGKGQDRVFVVDENGYKKPVFVDSSFKTPKVGEGVSYDVFIDAYHFENKKRLKSYFKIKTVYEKK
jgi:hypothetical protein